MNKRSIHPRVVGGRTQYTKVNTRKSPLKETKERLVRALREHTTRHPSDTQSVGRLARLGA